MSELDVLLRAKKALDRRLDAEAAGMHFYEQNESGQTKEEWLGKPGPPGPLIDMRSLGDNGPPVDVGSNPASGRQTEVTLEPGVTYDYDRSRYRLEPVRERCGENREAFRVVER